MNLADGKILDAQDCDGVLDTLNDRILATLAKPPLRPETVVEACDRLVSTLNENVYLPLLQALGIPEGLGRGYAAQARAMFSGDALRHRLQTELGGSYAGSRTLIPSPGSPPVEERLLPLGVLLHVAAGNADGLPAFSVIEGLLTGNINILKLPAAEGGLSVWLLLELIRIEPLLVEYIYVFDYSSKDMVHINKLIDAADGVVVWGGVEAVSAFRSLAPPNVRLIEWGHKVSFAYVTMDGLDDDKLYGLAKNIAVTGQLLCSSCQGVYVDTEDSEEVYAFCRRFLPLLEKAVAEYAGNMEIGTRAQAALQRYTAELETALTDSRVFTGRDCSLIACPDRRLEPAMGFANTWVKALPRARLPETLRPYKNYLQTAALLCGAQEEAVLTDLLLRCGVVRISPGERMSETYPGAPHDGEYPLRRYTRVASVEKA